MNIRPVGLHVVRLLVFCLAIPAISVAQKVDWNAGELARPFPKPATETQLIEQLRTAPPEGKAMACKQLSIYGGKAAVPELAKLLGDEQLSSWARVALEAIPDPSADAALLEAAEKLDGKLLVGVINSIGVRRSDGAVDLLAERLTNANADVASAAAVALGRIGNEEAVHQLHDAYADATPKLRAAIAEGGILCAERQLADGNKDLAIAIYDAIRAGEVPQQRVLEATRGAILARGEDGVPILVEQLTSPDKKRFNLGLMVARELPGPAVADAIARAMAQAPPERAAMMVVALGDRGDRTLSPAVVKAATSGDKPLRLAAIGVIGRAGDASAVSALLEIGANSDRELAEAAQAALAGLRSEQVNAELARRLPKANGKSRIMLIELIGQRRIAASPELIRLLKDSDRETRRAALVALGATVEAKDVPVLIDELNRASGEEDTAAAEKALVTACVRMKEREAMAAKLAAEMSKPSPAAKKSSLLRVLGAMGGPKALDTIAAAVKSGDEELQDAGTRALGEWMTPDAGPVLLEIAKSPAADKFRVRALRGYLRIARQQKMPDAERLAMCRKALEVADRDEERALVLDALKRCPSAESVKLASSLLEDEGTRDQAVEVAIFIGEKIKDKDPAAAKTAGEKALQADPQGKLAERARALTKSP